jgi:enoyl-CoA hydratase/carnithine racemase
MRTVQEVPQVVIARVHATAWAAGCQLVASCDLAVAAESATFALPGGKGGWFCHTPAVPVARNIGRKRLMELALTGTRSTRRPPPTGAWSTTRPRPRPRRPRGRAARPRDPREPAVQGRRQADLYAQLDRPEADAYSVAAEVMASMSQSGGAREGMASFLEKRAPEWTD